MSILKGKKVIVCDDEAFTRMEVAQMLIENGLELIALPANGRQAVEIVKSEKPDILVIDVCMPVMDGIQAAEKILEVQDMCIVILSAIRDHEVVESAKEVGVFGYVEKPVVATKLVDTLEAAWLKFKTKHGGVRMESKESKINNIEN